MRAYFDNITKPRCSLGKLEEYCEKTAPIQRRVPPRVSKKAVYVFGGDRGIADEGFFFYPKEASFRMVLKMLSGGAGLNALADATGWEARIRRLRH
jgi:nicotinate-nucleotide--dimethylbenzimidazole phosphoribosyltransferase